MNRFQRVESRQRCQIPAGLISVLTMFAIGSAALAEQQVFESTHHEFRLNVIAPGLEFPWSIAFLPGDEMLVTERPGRLRRLQSGALDPTPVTGVPEVFAENQGGLLDVAIDPNFDETRYIYLSYSKPGERGATTALARGRYTGNAVEDLVVLFEADAWSDIAAHFGGRIAFDTDGMLYLTIGDRAEMNRAQDLADHAGTTVRLHRDGRIPDDNPFVGHDYARAEIFTYGHRNAQGLVYDANTGELWLNEHGPRGGDEVNRLLAGANYGWPVVTHGRDYSGERIGIGTEAEGMVPPVRFWTPSIAPSGTAVYAGEPFTRWRGDLFVGALAGMHIARLRIEDDEVIEDEILLEGYWERIRDVRNGPDGFVYFLTDAHEGVLGRLEPVDQR